MNIHLLFLLISILAVQHGTASNDDYPIANLTTTQLICQQCLYETSGLHCEMTMEFYDSCVEGIESNYVPINESVWVLHDEYCAVPTVPLLEELPAWVSTNTTKPAGYPEDRTPSPILHPYAEERFSAAAAGCAALLTVTRLTLLATVVLAVLH
ncbi:uncharacterized protein LOC122363311 [Amphibalanus amphitrite]|uniref:uncharacterized protein LOC122363311 n=1 Tax=Amphibalanus amphitrite TaxID=1232801 RepID=UPI001C8FB5EB|nr:uncharacterized protein LOC122363311 [Amphibalanus amphitrite]